jgi:hypothetical protein
MSTLDSPSPFVPGLHPAGSAASPAAAAPQAPLPAARPRTRRPWMWVALVASAFLLAVLLAFFAVGLGWIEPVRIFVDGEQVYGGPNFESMSAWELFALCFAALLALLVSLFIVPLALALAVVVLAAVVVFSVVIGLGLPLLLVLLVVGLLLSPLILLGWLLIKLLS